MTDSTMRQPGMGTRELSERLDPRLLLAVAFVQGIALFLLNRAEEFGTWPSTDPIADTVLKVVVSVLPLGILLGATTTNLARFLTGALLFTVLAALLAAYAGYLLAPNQLQFSNTHQPYFYASGLVLCFKALIYPQLWAARLPITYDRFFLLSWRNLLVTSISYQFMGILWLILWLWGTLFKLVEIDFFSLLLEEDWFRYPALALAAGLGFVIFRRLGGIIDTFSRVLRALCFFLLPLLSMILLSFLGVLPVTGLGTLWATGHGSGLVLWLICLYLVFFNATYRVEDGFSGYPAWLEKLVLVGLAVTPIYAAIALYGIWLRIDQYGLTVDRCWALTIGLLLMGLTVMYAVQIARARLSAPPALGVTNIRFGWVVMGLMVLVNTPAMDFKKMALGSQLAAWERGEVSDEDLDVSYIARHLGRHGYLALMELKEQGPAELATRIEEAYKSWPFRPRAHRLTPDDLKVWHTERPAPEKLVQAIIKESGITRALPVHLVPVELDDQAPTEWFVIYEYTDKGDDKQSVWYREEGEWKRWKRRIDVTYRLSDFRGEGGWEEFLQDPTSIRALPPKWKNIKMDGVSFVVRKQYADTMRRLTPDDLVVWHTDEPAPEALVQTIIEWTGGTDALQVHLVPVELNGEAPSEWLSIHDKEPVFVNQYVDRFVWYQEKGEWKRHSLNYFHRKANKPLEKLLQDPSSIEAVAPHWKTIWIGDREVQLRED